MIECRPLESFGYANHGWLEAHHHFSFANYYHPQRNHWGRLRVWNDDTIQPNTGFPLHPHENMEIITYVRQGAITHEDSLGNRGETAAGDVQVMSAGTGIYHSEYNFEATPAHIFQIWILPDQKNTPPYWGSKPFPKANGAARCVVLASGMAGDEDALPLRARARVLAAFIKEGESLDYTFADREGLAYLVAATGGLHVNGVVCEARDALAIQDEPSLRITAQHDSEVVWVELPRARD